MMDEPKPRVHVRAVGRLWLCPTLPIPVQCIRRVVLVGPPHAVALMVDGAGPRFARIERRGS